MYFPRTEELHLKVTGALQLSSKDYLKFHLIPASKPGRRLVSPSLRAVFLPFSSHLRLHHLVDGDTQCRILKGVEMNRKEA
jgi:hypothetical protein